MFSFQRIWMEEGKRSLLYKDHLCPARISSLRISRNWWGEKSPFIKGRRLGTYSVTSKKASRIKLWIRNVQNSDHSFLGDPRAVSWMTLIPCAPPKSQVARNSWPSREECSGGPLSAPRLLGSSIRPVWRNEFSSHRFFPKFLWYWIKFYIIQNDIMAINIH